jgi:hypothetical protein
MTDFDPLEKFKESEEYARKAYLRQVRKIIGSFYLLISTYVPLSFALDLTYTYFFNNTSILSLILKYTINSPIIYVTYIIFAFALIFKLRKIPKVMTRIMEIDAKSTKIKRTLYSNLFYFFFWIGIILLLSYTTYAIKGEIGIILGETENFVILLLIIRYFYSIFSLLKVDRPSKEDYIALIGAIIGFVGGTLISPFLFFVFSVSWMYAGLNIIRKYW